MKLKEKIAFKKELYRYHKKNNNYKKQLRKVINKYSPCDYSYMVELISLCLHHMKEYYADGDNVCSGEAIDLEHKNYPSRLEIAERASYLLDKYYEEFENTYLEEVLKYLSTYIAFLWD